MTLDEIERVAVTRGPGLIGALLVGVASAKALAAARGLPLTAVDHLHGHVVASTLGRRPDRGAVPVPGGQRRPHVPGPRRPPRLVRGDRPDAGRRRRRGVRQGRAAARAGLPRRPGAGPAGAAGRPGRVRLPPLGPRGRAGLQLQRREDRAAVRHPRPGRGAGRGPPGRPGRLLPARDRDRAGGPDRPGGRPGGRRPAGHRRRRGRQQRAARDADRARGRAGRPGVGPAARAVHRQRRDDRRRCPLHRAAARTRTTWRLDAAAQARSREGHLLRQGRLPPVRGGLRRGRAPSRTRSGSSSRCWTFPSIRA